MQQRPQEAVILIGHGSLRSASGASMIRIAARLREEGIAAIVEPAFLNFNRPTLADALDRCRAAGAHAVAIQPYFLIEGAYVRHDLRKLVGETLAHARQSGTAELPVRIAPAFGHHPALVELALQRICEAAPEQQLQPALAADSPPSPEPGVQPSPNNRWGLLLMAHGTPLPEANAPLYTLLDDLLQATGIAQGRVAYLDCNAPDIPQGIAELAQAGVTQLVTMPYFLHMGRHVREDLPQHIAAMQEKLPHVRIIQAQHLDYDLRLVRVIADRLAASTTEMQD